MANRSYLYTCNSVPGSKGFAARGLAECAWDIPLVFRLLVANQPKVVRSAIWHHDIAILARRDGAFERAIAFLAKVGEGKLARRGDFDRALTEMKAFLAAAPPSRYVLLEAGEIFDGMGGELAERAAELAAQIPMMAKIAEGAIAGTQDKWLAGVRKKWAELANPGEWSDVLYFDLAPKAKAKAKAKTKAKKPAPKAKAKTTPKAKKPSKPATKVAPTTKPRPAPKAKAKKPAAKPKAKKPAAK